MVKYKNIDEYINFQSLEVRSVLMKLRLLINKLAPECREDIKYGMPTFVLKGNLIHFAAYKSHIGLYPSPGPIEKFAKELSEYKTSKGAIQFPINKDLPWELIERIIKYRIEENLRS